MLTAEEAYTLLQTRYDRLGKVTTDRAYGGLPRLFMRPNEKGKVVITVLIKNKSVNKTIAIISAKEIERLKTLPNIKTGICGHRPDMFSSGIVNHYVKFGD